LCAVASKLIFPSGASFAASGDPDATGVGESPRADPTTKPNPTTETKTIRQLLEFMEYNISPNQTPLTALLLLKIFPCTHHSASVH
jgi:hypothetical protein